MATSRKQRWTDTGKRGLIRQQILSSSTIWLCLSVVSLPGCQTQTESETADSSQSPAEIGNVDESVGSDSSSETKPTAAGNHDAHAEQAGSDEHNHGSGRGMMGPGRGGMGHGMMAGNRQDMVTLHALFDGSDRIKRTVKNLPNGAETLTESEDADIAGLIQEHVPAMETRVEENSPLPPMRFHPLFQELIKHKDKVDFQYESTDRGLKVTYTSDDPYVVLIIQEHAKLVSRFIRNGMQEVHKPYEIPEQTTSEVAPATIFANRILPILKADNSSSCTECHFSGVELSDYIHEDQAETFASLRAGGLIDVGRPDESKILKFIGRHSENPDPLIENVRQTEFTAFRTWIRAAVKDPDLLKATSKTDLGTTLPLEVIRHARKDRVLSSFIDNIWSEMGRCVNCHSPDRNRSKIGHNGLTKEDVDAISWIVPHDPAATLRKLVDSGNIDTDTPEDSHVLTKPAGIVEHGGGPKFHPGSTTYRNFARFLSDYAAVASGTYRLASDLPSASKEVSRLSEQQLRLTDIPSQFKELPMQVNLYRWNGETKAWSEDRWATAFSTVNAEKLIWQNPILVTAPRDSERAPTLKKDALLPAGAYLIRIYADTEQKTRNDPLYVLDDDEFVGQVEITGEWKPGYQPPKIVKFPTKDSNHASHRRRQSGHDHNQPHGDEKDSLAIGAKVPDFEVTLKGHRRKLSDLQKDRTLTADGTLVLTFWCSFCHSCRHVEKDLDKLASEFNGKAGVIAIDSSVGETQQDITTAAEKAGITLPIALDPSGTVADIFGAKATTTTVVIDASGRLRYFGRFSEDDHASAETALRSVLNGESVAVARTRPHG